eukprot:scaffold165380_cov24-Tisochrysis_lutea.AAC.4
MHVRFLCVGSDGGGSIRIPSSFCGLVGLKPTQGRVSMEGAVEVDCSVATIGPMCACVQVCVHALAWYVFEELWLSGLQSGHTQELGPCVLAFRGDCNSGSNGAVRGWATGFASCFPTL